jgi:ribonuclease D
MGPEMIGLFVPLGFFAMVVAIVVGRPMIKAYATRVENESKRPQIPAEVMNRLERIEQAVDAIAVEVERISEGQRFTTKLLSEPRSGPALPSPSASAGDASPT